MAKTYTIEGVELDKDQLASLKSWIEDGVTFWKIIARMREDETLRATIPYSESVDCKWVDIQRNDAVSKHWAFNAVLDLVQEIREKK